MLYFIALGNTNMNVDQVRAQIPQIRADITYFVKQNNAEAVATATKVLQDMNTMVAADDALKANQ